MKSVLMVRMIPATIALALAGLSFNACADGAASDSSMPGMKMPMDQPASGQDSPSTQAFKEGEASMMHDMSGPYTGNADRDFVAHMIPHHQGAVSMAQVELKYGKDPEMRKLAKEIIEAQDKEIALMKRWQAKHGGQ
jgi:uncharacterized protein (DUF305 family)